MNEIFSAAEERAVTLKGIVGSFPVTVLDLRILVKSGVVTVRTRHGAFDLRITRIPFETAACTFVHSSGNLSRNSFV